MADPITGTLAAVGMGATALGGLFGAAGAKQQAAANAQADYFKSAEAQYQAGIAAQNQQINTTNALYARQAGEVEAQQIAMQTKQEIGEVKAQQGAGNLDVNSGSNADVRRGLMEVGEENMALERNQAAKQAYGFQVAAVQYGEQSQWDLTESTYYTQAAGYAQTAGDINATTSILGSVGKMAGMGATAYKSGVFGT